MSDLEGYPWMTVENALDHTDVWRDDGSFDGDQEVGLVLAVEVRLLRDQLDHEKTFHARVVVLNERYHAQLEDAQAAALRLGEENAKLVADRDMHAKHAAGAARELEAARNRLAALREGYQSTLTTLRCALSDAEIRLRGYCETSPAHKPTGNEGAR